MTLPAATRAKVRELAATGASQADVAAAAGCSAESVRRILAEPVEPVPDLVGELRALAADLDFDPDRSAVVRRAIAALEADTAPEPIELAPDATPAQAARELLARLRAAHHRAEAVGDQRHAGHCARTIASLLPAVERLDRTAREDGDVFRISRAELAEAAVAYRQRVAATVAQPVTCSRCGAIVRADMAGVPPVAVMPPGAQ